MTCDIDALQRRLAALEARARRGTSGPRRDKTRLYRIAEAASAAEDLHASYATVRRIVAGLICADNAYSTALRRPGGSVADGLGRPNPGSSR